VSGSGSGSLAVEAEWVDIDSPAGPVSCFRARPSRATAPLPGLLVLQEFWGVDRYLTDLTERAAAAGYVAVAPDLNSAGGGRPPAFAHERVERSQAFLEAHAGDDYPTFMSLLLSTKRRAALDVPAEVDETIVGLLKAGADPRHRGVVHAVFRALRDDPACTGRVGALGFCQGGALAGQLAADEPDLGACVIYYGASPTDEEAARIRCPVRGFHGSEDTRIVEGLPAFAAALDAAGVDHEILVYPGALHAFANDTRPWYDADASRDAWARSLSFLAQTLGPHPADVVG
jgi:carboxymethylenebutenolidase